MRPRTTIAALSLAIAGTVFALPGMAGADPTISATTGGVDVIGTTGQLGQVIDINGTGCTSSTGGAAYMGEFVGQSADLDPQTLMQPFETQTDETGNMEWSAQISLDNTVGTFYAHWYCSDTPVTSLDDPSLRWVSPVLTMTIIDPSASGMSAQRMSLKSAATKSVAAKSAAATSGVTITMDPDSLPAVDRMGIFGPQAAALKGRVDAKLPLKASYDRNLAKAKDATKAATVRHNFNTYYVKQAFSVLGAKKPSAAAIASQVAKLDAGGLRVQAVEDIALSVHSADYWNAHTAV